MIKNKLGQYFTTNIILQKKIFEFILNEPSNILEPSFGRGDLIKYIIDKNPTFTEEINKHNIMFQDYFDICWYC